MTRNAVPARPLPSATTQQAVGRITDLSVVRSSAFREREMRASREACHPDLLDFGLAFVRDLKGRGMPFFPHCFYRGEEEQNRLFAEGRSKAKFGKSPHNFGMAMDLVHFGRFWNLNEKEWAIIGQIGKEVARKRNVRVTWGGDWDFYDPAHWELADWKLRVQKGDLVGTDDDWQRVRAMLEPGDTKTPVRP